MQNGKDKKAWKSQHLSSPPEFAALWWQPSQKGQRQENAPQGFVILATSPQMSAQALVYVAKAREVFYLGWYFPIVFRVVYKLS